MTTDALSRPVVGARPNIGALLAWLFWGGKYRAKLFAGANPDRLGDKRGREGPDPDLPDDQDNGTGKYLGAVLATPQQPGQRCADRKRAHCDARHVAERRGSG